jgi:hypothetical protein
VAAEQVGLMCWRKKKKVNKAALLRSRQGFTGLYYGLIEQHLSKSQSWHGRDTFIVLSAGYMVHGLSKIYEA